MQFSPVSSSNNLNMKENYYTNDVHGLKPTKTEPNRTNKYVWFV